MSESNHAIKDPMQAPKETEALRTSGDHLAKNAHNRLLGESVAALTSGTGAIASGRERFGRQSNNSIPQLELAMTDKPGNNPAQNKKGEAKANEANLPKPLAEEYKRNGKSIPIHSHQDTMPSTSKIWDPSTGILKETFPNEWGMENSIPDYGGIVMNIEISQTVAFRGEVTIDGKPGKMIELKDMKGISGYGSVLGITGETPVRSVKMWQVQTGKDKQGNPVYESSQEAVIDKVDWRGKPVIDKKTGKPQQEIHKEKMSNEHFNKQYENLDLEKLRQYIMTPKKTDGNTKIAETEEKKTRPAID